MEHIYVDYVQVGTIRVGTRRFDNASFINNYASIYYRYVLIPGGVSGGRFSSGPAVGYSTDQLKNMTYEQIVALFGIPAAGASKK